jgi:hypothetical protein
MNRQHVNCSRPASFRPRVECLEGRLTPAVLVSQAPGSDVILIHATGRRDAIQIVDRGDNGAGAIIVSGTGLAAFPSAALRPRAKAVINIFTSRATIQVDYVARGTAAHANPRTVVVNVGSPAGSFRQERARQVTTRAGQRVRVVVNRASPAAGLTLTVHGRGSRPVTIRSAAGSGTSAQQGTAQSGSDESGHGTEFVFGLFLPNAFPGELTATFDSALGGFNPGFSGGFVGLGLSGFGFAV